MAMTGVALDEAFFVRSVSQVAPDLLGCTIEVGDLAGEIVEVERYQQDDPASHSFRGPTPRAAVMFGPPGRLYVYRSYGLHWCANVVCEPEGSGAAVLLRAVAPTRGVDVMHRRRGTDDPHKLCSGPGRLCEAFGIDGAMNGVALGAGPVRIVAGDPVAEIAVGPRVGISVATDKPWRFGVAGSRHLSRAFPREVAA
jgi:DNA-3-methyladenine glycosylase